MIYFGKPKFESVEFTPAMAQSWIDLYTYGRQRAINPRHVNFMKQVREHGEFNPYAPIECATIAGKIRSITNGHHRLWMIAQGTKPQVLCVVYVPVHTEEDIARLYATHDNGGKQRTIADIATAYGTDKVLDLPAMQLTKIGAAALIVSSSFAPHRCGLDYENKSPTFRNELLCTYGPFAKKFFDATAGADVTTKKLLMNQAVLSVMLATYMNPATEKKAQEFFVGMALDDGLKRGDPRKTLLDYLRRRALEHGNPRVNLMIHNVASAWNYFWKGEQLMKLAIRDATLPVTILGTSFLGKKTYPASVAKSRGKTSVTAPVGPA